MGWVWVKMGINGAFGVTKRKDNEKRVVDFRAERELVVGHMCLKNRNLHRCIRVTRVREGMEIMSITDLVLVKRDMI